MKQLTVPHDSGLEDVPMRIASHSSTQFLKDDTRKTKYYVKKPPNYNIRGPRRRMNRLLHEDATFSSLHLLQYLCLKQTRKPPEDYLSQ